MEVNESDNAGGPISIIPAIERPSIGAVVKEFVRHIDSLAETLPLSMMLIAEVHKSSTAKMQEFQEQHCHQEIINGKTTSVVNADQYWRYKRLAARLDRTALADHLVPRSFLISLISQYDAFLGALIRTLFLLQPAKLNESKKTLTYSDLVDFESIQAARDYVIEKEVESVLRDSHADQFDWLEDRFQVKLRKDLDIWPAFIEVTQRRNLFVHSSGVVSSQYLSVCRRHGCEGLEDVKRGKELHVAPPYFAASHACILEIGVKLAHVLWRKEQPDDRAAADSNFIEITFDLLVERRWMLAQRLLDFGTQTLKRWSSDERKRTLVINRCQAYKWGGESDIARRILEAEDWSAAADKFKLAEAVLHDDFARAASLMARLGADSKDIQKGDYQEWPLFREFRKSTEFLSAFEQLYGEPFRITTLKGMVGPAGT